MREIKFRGKNHKNEWKYGFYFEYTDTGGDLKGHVVPGVYSSKPFEEFIIDRKTLGQYTGLKDENGKEIYEGDMVELGVNMEFPHLKFIIKYKKCSFIADCTIKGFGHYLSTIIDNGWNMRVIGNIHENKELLKS